MSSNPYHVSRIEYCVMTSVIQRNIQLTRIHKSCLFTSSNTVYFSIIIIIALTYIRKVKNLNDAVQKDVLGDMTSILFPVQLVGHRIVVIVIIFLIKGTDIRRYRRRKFL